MSNISASFNGVYPIAPWRAVRSALEDIGDPRTIAGLQPPTQSQTTLESSFQKISILLLASN
jgi:hypothetical protein